MININACKCFYFILKSHQPSERGFYKKVQAMKMGGCGRGQSRRQMDQWPTTEHVLDGLVQTSSVERRNRSSVVFLPGRLGLTGASGSQGQD